MRSYTVVLDGREFVVTKHDDGTFEMPPELAAIRGRGVALKPASEHWILVRKPIETTVAANVLRYGTGGLNIDATRVGFASDDDEASAVPGGKFTSKASGAQAATPDAGRDIERVEYEDPAMARRRRAGEPSAGRRYTDEGATPFAMTPGPRGGAAAGRWPPNVVLSHAEGCQLLGKREVQSGSQTSDRPDGPSTPAWDGAWKAKAGASIGMEEVEEWACVEGCPVLELDRQSGQLTSGTGAFMRRSAAENEGNTSTAFGAENRPEGTEVISYGDTGGASRFFPTFRYVTKPSRTERNLGVESEPRALNWSSGEQSPGTFQSEGTNRMAANFHPTVKPVELCAWLCRLVTPPGGTVLDCFLGSGTTGVAAVAEGFDFIGIERDPHFFAIAQARIAYAVGQVEAMLPMDWSVARATPRPRVTRPHVEPVSQETLFDV